MDAHNEEVTVYYISPLDFVTYLLEKAPEVLLGGHFKETDGKQQLESFWDNYEKIHPSHVLFQENHEHRSRSNTLCLSFHGDEGRGLKKGNTAILMMESNLGLETCENYHKKRRLDQCQHCCLRQRCSKRFKVNSGYMTQKDSSYDPVPASFETHNTKLNSFLTKYVLAALPNSLYKETNALEIVIQKISADFRLLFERGVVIRGQPWFAAVTGLKGDLKWYEKIACLERCFNKQLGSGLAMCHECGAGTPEKPFEDFQHYPAWGTSLFCQRPWGENSPDISEIPFDAAKPEMILRRDIFHNTKVGLLRDYVGSSILILVRLGYFNDQDPGSSNSRDACLDRAHAHFYFFCKTITGKRAALQSFSASFLNAKTQSDYGWISSKGSDTTLLVRWLKVLSEALMNDPIDPAHLMLLKHMNLAAQCVLGWQQVLYSHGNWLPRHCAMVVLPRVS